MVNKWNTPDALGTEESGLPGRPAADTRCEPRWRWSRPDGRAVPGPPEPTKTGGGMLKPALQVPNRLDVVNILSHSVIWTAPFSQT